MKVKLVLDMNKSNTVPSNHLIQCVHWVSRIFVLGAGESGANPGNTGGRVEIHPGPWIPSPSPGTMQTLNHTEGRVSTARLVVEGNQRTQRKPRWTQGKDCIK